MISYPTKYFSSMTSCLLYAPFTTMAAISHVTLQDVKIRNFNYSQCIRPRFLRVGPHDTPDKSRFVIARYCYLRQRGYVMLGVCLFVCLSVSNSRTNYWTDFHENFATDVPVDKEELVKFWKSSATDRNVGIFLLRDRVFSHNLAHISGQTNWSSWKFYHKWHFEQRSPVTF